MSFFSHKVDELPNSLNGEVRRMVERLKSAEDTILEIEKALQYSPDRPMSTYPPGGAVFAAQAIKAYRERQEKK